MNDIPYLDCRNAFSVKVVKSDIVTQDLDDFMYDLFGSMINQTAVL